MNPFDPSGRHFHPSRNPKIQMFYEQIRRAYGVKDPEAFYVGLRKRLIDGAKKDPYGITEHETLDDWWNWRMDCIRAAERMQIPNAVNAAIREFT